MRLLSSTIWTPRQACKRSLNFGCSFEISMIVLAIIPALVRRAPPSVRTSASALFPPTSSSIGTVWRTTLWQCYALCMAVAGSPASCWPKISDCLAVEKKRPAALPRQTHFLDRHRPPSLHRGCSIAQKISLRKISRRAREAGPLAWREASSLPWNQRRQRPVMKFATGLKGRGIRGHGAGDSPVDASEIAAAQRDDRQLRRNALVDPVHIVFRYICS